MLQKASSNLSSSATSRDSPFMCLYSTSRTTGYPRIGNRDARYREGVRPATPRRETQSDKQLFRHGSARHGQPFVAVIPGQSRRLDGRRRHR